MLIITFYIVEEGKLKVGIKDYHRNVVAWESDHLDVSFGELGGQLSGSRQLSRANGSEVVRVREEYAPRVADVVVQVELAFISN